jgi:hypothetical protein
MGFSWHEVSARRASNRVRTSLPRPHGHGYLMPTLSGLRSAERLRVSGGAQRNRLSSEHNSRTAGKRCRAVLVTEWPEQCHMFA